MNDDLSRLLAGELPEAEAAELRSQIATDPVLGRKWAAMQALPGHLRALPTEMTPPPLVVAAPNVIPLRPAAVPVPPPAATPQMSAGSVVKVDAPARSKRAGAWLPLLLAAGLAIGYFAPRPAEELRIIRGASVVSGHFDVLAGDIPIDLDGKVEIFVEPPRGVSRERQAEIQSMDKSHFLSALAGSVITLTVVEGTALAHPAGSPPVKLSAGEHRTLGQPEEAAPAVVAKSGPASAADVTAHELAALKLEHAITVGQLRALGGRPVEWPDDIAPKYRAEAFESFVRGRVASIPNSSLVAVDCDEYPCIAVVRSTDLTDQWEDKLMAVHDGLDETEYGPDNGVVGFGNIREDERGIAKLYAFSILPGTEGGFDQEVTSRLNVRASGDMEGLSQELLDETDQDE